MVAPAISRAETHQCRDGAMPWSGHGSGNIRLSRTSRRRNWWVRAHQHTARLENHPLRSAYFVP